MLDLCVITGDPRCPDATKRGRRYNDEDLESHGILRAACRWLEGYRFEFFDDHARLLDRLLADRPALVVNFCDTGFRNVATKELHVPALLELLDIPYTGAGPACMVLCYDKQVVRMVAAGLGVPVPGEAFLPAGEGTLPEHWPALIKPNHGDGSLGITKDAVVRSKAEAEAYLAWLRAELPGRDLLVQEYLPGTEYSVGLIGNGEDLRALPLLEVDFAHLPEGLAPILSYESKAYPDSPYWTDIRYRPASAEPAVQDALIAHSKRLFIRLGCRDYARFDFRCASDGRPRLLEVNPNPAWAHDGKLALMAGFAGIGYPEMLDLIIGAAVRRLGLTDP